MTATETILRRLRLVLAAAATLALLILPSSALAKKHHSKTVKDRNHDGIPDKWEKKHGLSTTKRGVAKADPDKDGLRNRLEWQARTDPKSADTNHDGVKDANEDGDGDQVDNGNEQRERTNPRKADSDGDGVKDGKEDADKDKLNNSGEDNADTDPMNPDTDGDGVKDGDEHAGEVTAWDGSTLTIRVYGGQTLTGTVDENTYIGCAAGDDATDQGDLTSEDPTWSGDPTADELGKVASDDLGDDTDPGVDDPGADDPGTDDSTDDTGDDTGTDDSGDDSGDSTGDDTGTGADPCLSALKVGVKVSEASLDVSADGAFFDAIELAD